MKKVFLKIEKCGIFVLLILNILLILINSNLFIREEVQEFKALKSEATLKEEAAEYRLNFVSDCHYIDKIEFAMETADLPQVICIEDIKSENTYEIKLNDSESIYKYKADLNIELKDPEEGVEIGIIVGKNNAPEKIHGKVYYSIKHYLLFIVLILVIVSIFVYAILMFKGLLTRKNPLFLYPAYVLVSATLNYLMTEMIYNKSFYGIEIKPFCINILLHVSIVVFVSLLLNSVKWSAVLCQMIWLIIGFVNGFVFQARALPIQPQDLASFGTALNVANQYTYQIRYQDIVVLVLFTGCTIVFLLQDRMKWSESRKIFIRISGVIFFCVCLVGIKSDAIQEFILPEANKWNGTSTYTENGFLLSFMTFGTYLTVEKPEDYEISEIQNINKKYVNKEASVEEDLPNLIVIMSESLADFSSIRELSTNCNEFEFWDQLTENTIKGEILVSTKGGGTANTEYEFLTGNSISFFSYGYIPYVTNWEQLDSSIAWNLKEQGYETIAMHPGTRTNWSRDRVYPKLGFDTFYSVESFDDWKEWKRDMVTDYANFEKILEIIRNRENDKPYFLFNVTIQNHSDYVTNVVPITVYTEDANYLDINEYLTLIKKSDDALEYLIQELQKEEEKTAVVIFGDHYPGINNEQLSWIYEKSIDTVSLEEMQMCHTVPFMIWTNYDIEEEEAGLLSANYLGSYVLDKLNLNMKPWNYFLLDLQKNVQAMNVLGYTLDGSVYQTYDDIKQQPAILREYFKLQYNQLFDESERLIGFYK